MIRIVGETFKNAVAIELIKTMPGVAVYKESVTNPVFPNNFIYQLNVETSGDRKNKEWLRVFMTIRYRAAQDVSADLKVQQKLDDAALSILGGLDKVYVENIPIPVKGLRTEKVDNILHIFFKFEILVTKEQLEGIKQQTLTLATILRGVD